jgi:hypothetical protein
LTAWRISDLLRILKYKADMWVYGRLMFFDAVKVKRHLERGNGGFEV